MQQQGEATGGADCYLQMRMRGKEEEQDCCYLQMKGKEEEEVLATWDCGSPLYDSFELASLHYVLEKHTMLLPFPNAGAVSRSRRFEQNRHLGGAALPDPGMAKTSNRGAQAARHRRRRKVGRTRGTKQVAAAIFRAVTCWRRL